VLFVVRVSSDKQTLILAGEPTPPRRPDAGRTDVDRAGMGSQLQRVTMLLVQGEYAAGAPAADSSHAESSAVVDSERVPLPSPAAVEWPAPVDGPAVSAQFLVPQPVSGRALSSGAAEYARMQNSSGGSTRIQLIDTYA
jgi:hypothetical protein